MKLLFVLPLILFSLIFAPQNASSQHLNTIFGNTAMGAATGAALGTATMALQNSNDFTPLQFGLGAGILGGLAIGLYDVTSLSGGQVYGTFQSFPNTTSIIFLDTMYGAGIGGLIGIAIALMDNSKLVDGLQYGAGIGAWVGFSFGLIDGFYLARRGDDSQYFDYEDFSHLNSETSIKGLFKVVDTSSMSMKVVNPTVTTLSAVSILGDTKPVENHFSVDIVNLQIRF